MFKLYKHNASRFIQYNIHKEKIIDTTTVIFLHGLKSNMEGKKSSFLMNWCIKNKFHYICFDNFGHGMSSGVFIEENISSWLSGLKLIIDELTYGKVIIIGSSMGGWLALLIANMQKYKDKIIGILTLAAAVDFTEELIWNKLNKKQQEFFQNNGIINISGNNAYCNETYNFAFQMIEDGRKYLLLNKTDQYIDITCPVHLIHGMQDYDVPYNISERIANKLKSEHVIVKFIKDADHRLSRDSDLLVMENSLHEILNTKSSPRQKS